MDPDSIVIIRDESFPALLAEFMSEQKPCQNVVLNSNFDAFLCCGGGFDVPVHRVVLASVSDFLCNIFRECDSFEEVRIILDGMNIDVLRLIVEFAYTGNAMIPSSSADDVFEATQRLGIKFLKDSFVRLDHQDYEDIRAGRKTLDFANENQNTAVPESSDTESAESPDNARNDPGVDLEAQVDNESTMFSIENEPLASSTVVNFEPPAQQLQHPPLQTNLLRQIVPEKLPSPIPMRIQLPKNRLFPGQTILMRRPDGTLVQVVVQRQPLQQQRQMIAQPARQPRKLFLPKGVQIQPKFAASKDTLAVAMEAILENPIHANDDVQVVPANQVNVSQRQMVSRPVPSKPPPVVSTTAKFPVSAPKPSPVKLSEHLTISDPKPTIPSTVPDDFLDDSSFSEVTFGGENDAVTNDVSAPAATPSATATLDDSATRKSGRERKVNRKYLDDESDEISKPSGDASKTSLKRRKETTSASSVDSKPKMKDELEETPPKKVRKVEKSSTESVKKVEDVETEKLTPRKTKKVDEKAIRMEDEKVDIRKDEKDQGKKNEKANKKKEKDDVEKDKKVEKIVNKEKVENKKAVAIKKFSTEKTKAEKIAPRSSRSHSKLNTSRNSVKKTGSKSGSGSRSLRSRN